MSELNYLQFQPIDPSSDDISEQHRHQDDIVLSEDLDENLLEKYWEQVVDDIHQDPDWFTFDNE
jgi:hypothetical protein